MNCIIASSQKILRYDRLQSVTLPAFSGEMEVLADHAETFVVLRKGKIILDREGGQREVFEIAGGECHIKDNNLVVVL